MAVAGAAAPATDRNHGQVEPASGELLVHASGIAAAAADRLRVNRVSADAEGRDAVGIGDVDFAAITAGAAEAAHFHAGEQRAAAVAAAAADRLREHAKGIVAMGFDDA